MQTYEALSLMLTFGLLLIALITYLDRPNKPNNCSHSLTRRAVI